MAPISAGSHTVEFCYPHFEPKERSGGRPAYALHVHGVDPDDQLAAFVLAPVNSNEPVQAFLARWGRTGVGPAVFMPVPAQLEDDRPAIKVHGFSASNFNWRSCQWEIARLVDPATLEMPSMDGDTVEAPGHASGAWAFRNGVPLADLDALECGEHASLGLVKESEAGSSGSYMIRFGGRIWRRWQNGSAQELELLAFDPESPVLQTALDSVWGEIGGQDEAKRELARAIQWPVLYPELFLLFKRRRSRGVLLYGPPGCGKTLLGKAVVRLLAALYHRKADDGGFKYVKGHQLLDQYVGNSEKAVKALFDESRRWRELKGYPAVLFFDEADALFKRRPANARESGFTLVPALLAEMDGMDESGAFLILATNRPDTLDPAITRPGRIDRRIRVTRPDEAASERIFRIHLDGVFLEEGLALEELCAHAAHELFSHAHKLYQVAFEDSIDEFLLKDLASGALIQNIVDRATANKMEYCIENNVRIGLNRRDLELAIQEVLTEQRESKHNEEMEEFAELKGKPVVSARKHV
ncbi:MAG: AAA family ATPase [Acidimicrobiia bacterium]|nr:AAA family ATPase [Acidimicrobiia bacterium]